MVVFPWYVEGMCSLLVNGSLFTIAEENNIPNWAVSCLKFSKWNGMALTSSPSKCSPWFHGQNNYTK